MGRPSKLTEDAFFSRAFASVINYCGRGSAQERDITLVFLAQHANGLFETAIPMAADDLIVEEMAFKYGRADLVVFHVDGSASVIEVKDGTKGYNHIVAGIGQVGLYATQLAMLRSVRMVRRCLMWSSTDDEALDMTIAAVCERAAVIPIPCCSTREMVAVSRKLLRDMGVQANT